jgi:hypothetical protein
MKKTTTHISILALTLVVACGLLTAGSAVAGSATPQQLKACHDHLWEVPKFRDIPNAGISIEGSEAGGKGKARVHWRVEWDNMHARGICMVDPDLTILHFEEHAYEADWEHGAAAPSGIYFDTRSRRWKTTDGQVCHTCTPENGFGTPAMDGPFYYDAEIRKWRDSSDRGAICHTCTPVNGFPIPAR